MANAFDTWKDTFTENGKNAIDGLKEVFDDANNNLLFLQLALTSATGVAKEVLERGIALEKELHKASIAALPLLTAQQKEDAPKIRKKIEESLKILEQFQNRQQVEANLLDKDEREEDIGDIDKDIKTEEDRVKLQIKEIESLAKVVRDIDEQVKSRGVEKATKEANYEDTADLVKDIEDKNKERQKKYEEFNEKKRQINLDEFSKRINNWEEKKKKKEAFLKKVEQSKVVIDYVKGNLLPIVVKLVVESLQAPPSGGKPVPTGGERVEEVRGAYPSTVTGVQFPGSWQYPKTPGYGTYPGSHDYEGIERYKEAVVTAIEHGYRHIDTAQTYRNEHYVGQAIRESGVPRSEIFLTSKLKPSKNSYDGALDGIKESQSALETAPDLFLIHYPGKGEATEAWKGLIKAKEDGLCKHIGVSNFEIKHLEQLIELNNLYHLEVNQIEFHPLLYSPELMQLVEYCKERGIQVEGYCPLAWGNKSVADYDLLNNTSINSIAHNYDVPSARVILKWCMQHGVRPLVGSLDPSHIAENAGPYDFELSSAEMTMIDALGGAQIRISKIWGWDPPNATMH